MTSRRAFLKGLVCGVAPLGAAAPAEAKSLSTTVVAGRDYFEELGVESYINALAPYSRLGGNQMWPEVIEAMNYGMSRRARMKDLHDAVGKRIASLVGCEAAMVTAGATSAITLGTAACLTGMDEERIQRLPDVTGMKSEVIIQKAHQYSYNHAVRNCGVRFRGVETVEDVEQTISDKTAMLYFVLVRAGQGKIDAETFAELGKRHRIPTFIDTATRVPPAENLIKLSNLGFDLNCFSGGKGLKGPYSAGLLLGRKDLIAAARRNGAPYDDTIGRGMKVSKEELLGMMVAVEVTLKHDLEAEKRVKQTWLDELDKELRSIPGVETERVLDRLPAMLIRWDERVKITPEEAQRQFREGSPSIETRLVDGVFSLNTWCLDPDQVPIVRRRLGEVLGGRA
jgi:seryl-tRNA(Sec) selenium transferase